MEHREKVEVCVVGGGVSGLSCAEYVSRSLISVCVIEGRDRLGGRVYSYPLKISMPSGQNEVIKVDLGGSWIHGQNNQLYKNHLLFGLKLKHEIEPRTEVENRFDEHIEEGYLTFTSDGKSIPGSTMVELEEFYQNIVEKCESKCHKIQNQINQFCAQTDRVDSITEEDLCKSNISDFSMEELVRKEIKNNWRRIERKFKSLPSGEIEKLFNLLLQQLELDYTSIDYSGIWFWDKKEVQPAGGDHLVVNTYDALVTYLTSQIEKNQNSKIYLNSTVTIISKIDEGYNVHFINGKDERIITTKFVVCSVPLGILKNEKIKFEPELPKWKQSAINNLGYGILNKVVVQFDKNFWGRHVEWLYIAEKNHDKLYVCNWYSLYYAAKVPILIGFVNRRLTEYFNTNNFSVERKNRKILNELKRCFGKDVEEHLVQIIWTNWESDEFSCGSYSYPKRNVIGGCIYYSQMEKPVDNILFCGEATSRKFPGTVTGAYTSGQREGVRIQQLLKNKS